MRDRLRFLRRFVNPLMGWFLLAWFGVVGIGALLAMTAGAAWTTAWYVVVGLGLTAIGSPS